MSSWSCQCVPTFTGRLPIPGCGTHPRDLLDGEAEREGVPDGGVAADSLGQLDRVFRAPAVEQSFQAALRQLSNRLVGILHGCLKTGTAYDERTDWAPRSRSTKLRLDNQILHQQFISQITVKEGWTGVPAALSLGLELRRR
jgi:hypothetical protein